MIELAVAMMCTGLLTAGVLRLVVDSARTMRARHRGIESVALVEAGADAAESTLESAGEGLEGARAVSLRGERIAVVAVAARTLRVVLPVAAAREVEPAAAGALRLADVAGLEIGERVAALGLAQPDSGEPLAAPPVGRIVALHRDRPRGASGGTVRVAWAQPEATVLAHSGEPRALLPLTIREIGVRSQDEGLQLRRRDLDGSWQPIIDGLDRLRFEIVRAGIVEIELSAAPPDAPRRTARRRVRVR